ncbi:TetR/AcrR family transcriptional regulator [Paraburkholderia sediminicola]|uniref:TetR/AcrR family transcriptional regulator n=1 Tax=Paraburkholderia sediminicola TaxID=458836 RepID=UPI0038BBF591
MDVTHKKERTQPLPKKRERTRSALVEVAVRVIAERGFDAPTIDDFIAAANIARGTFYNYFKTRDELINAAAAHVADMVDAEILPLFTGIDDPAHRIAMAVRTFIELSIRNPEWGWLLVRTIPLRGGAVSDEMNRGVVYDLECGQASGRFRLPSIPAALALSLGTITMAIRTVVAEPTPEDFPETIAAMILRGLGMSVAEAKRVAAKSLPPNPLSLP